MTTIWESTIPQRSTTGHDAAHRALHKIIRDTVYARDYVVWDGVTDDSAGLQAAIDKAVSSGARVVILPPGTGYLASPVIVSARPLRIEGAGVGITVIKPETTAFAFNTTSIDLVRCELSGMTIDGGTDQITIAGALPFAGNRFSNLHLWRASSSGIKSTCEFGCNVMTGVTVSGVFDGASGTSPNYGIWLGGSGARHLNTFYGCAITNTLLAGLYLDGTEGGGADKNALYSCLLDHHWRHAILASRAQSLIVVGGGIETNSRESFGTYADFHFELSAVEPPRACKDVMFIGLGGSFTLAQEPHVFLRADSAALDNVTLINCLLDGYDIDAGGADVTMLGLGNVGINNPGNIAEINNGTFVLRSPNATRYALAVADDGTLSAAAVT